MNAKKIFLDCIKIAVFAAVVVVAVLKVPALFNFVDPGETPSVNVEFIWTGPYEVQIAPYVQSSIPQGYSLYIYRVEPLSRTDNGYTVSSSADDWTFLESTTGFRKLNLVVDHSEILEVACVRTGTDPKTVSTADTIDFDTAELHEFRIDLKCH